VCWLFVQTENYQGVALLCRSALSKAVGQLLQAKKRPLKEAFLVREITESGHRKFQFLDRIVFQLTNAFSRNLVLVGQLMQGGLVFG